MENIQLINEEGIEENFILLDDFSEDEVEYLAVMSDKADEVGEVVFMQVIEAGDQTDYEIISDQRACEALYEIFKARNIDEFDFDDE